MAIQGVNNSTPQKEISTQTGVDQTRASKDTSTQAPVQENKVESDTYQVQSKKASEAYRDQKRKEADSGEVRPFQGTSEGSALGDKLNKQLDANPAGPLNGDMKLDSAGDKQSATAEMQLAKPSLELKRGALLPPDVDRSKLGVVDKTILSAMNLEEIPPGGSITVKGSLSADGAVVLGGYAGAETEISIKRSATDPNKFTIGMAVGGKAGVMVNGDSTAGAAGFDAEGKLGVGGSVKVEMTADLSKPGEAKELAGFLAHTVAAGTLPSSMNTVLNVIEAIPGVNVPGEPGPYLRDHISALEVSGNVTLSGNLAGTVFGGAKGSVAGYLKGGGRIDFKPDGSKVLTAKGMVGGNFGASVKAGDAIYGSVKVGGARVETGGQSQITFDKDWNLDKVSHGLTVNGNIMAAGVGVEVKGSVNLETLIEQHPEAGQKIKDAIQRGDFKEVVNIFENDIAAKDGIRFEGQVNGFTQLGGTVGGKLKELGVGGEIGLTGGITTKVPIASGELQLNSEGVSIKGSVDSGLVKVEGSDSFTYEQLLEAWKDVDYAGQVQD